MTITFCFFLQSYDENDGLSIPNDIPVRYVESPEGSCPHSLDAKASAMPEPTDPMSLKARKATMPLQSSMASGQQEVFAPTWTLLHTQHGT